MMPYQRIIFAWLVHLYTASGAVIALVTLFFIEDGRIREAFGLMALAVLVDASDGTLARRAKVKEVIPGFDGDRLEDIIDYLNYVVVPAFFVVRAELLPHNDALWIAALPLLASAYGFCQKEAKTSDHFFLGFPSYWNIVAFYMYVMQTPQWLNAFFVIVFSALVFIPIRYIYPSRSPVLRTLTVSLGTLWGILMGIMIYLLPRRSTLAALASLLFPVYYIITSLWLETRRPHSGI